MSKIALPIDIRHDLPCSNCGDMRLTGIVDAGMQDRRFCGRCATAELIYMRQHFNADDVDETPLRAIVQAIQAIQASHA